MSKGYLFLTGKEQYDNTRKEETTSITVERSV